MKTATQERLRVFRRELVVANARGLHARAAAKFVKTSVAFSCHIEVSNGKTTVNGHSILGLMMLAACRGSSLCVTARGADAEAALDALAALVARKFDEE